MPLLPLCISALKHFDQPVPQIGLTAAAHRRGLHAQLYQVTTNVTRASSGAAAELDGVGMLRTATPTTSSEPQQHCDIFETPQPKIDRIQPSARWISERRVPEETVLTLI